MDEVYVGTRQLSAKIGLAPQTIYNCVWSGKLIAGVHYFKPLRNRKLLFKLSAIQGWLEGDPPPDDPFDGGSSTQGSSDDEPSGSAQTADSTVKGQKVERKSKPASPKPKSWINI